MRNEIEARDPDALERVTDRADKAIAERYGPGPVSDEFRPT